MNPHDVQVEDETTEMVFCQFCQMEYPGVDTRWFTGESVGEAECPVCENVIEVPEPDIEDEPIGRYLE